MIIILIVLAIVVFALAIPLAIFIVASQGRAKKEAKKILATGNIEDTQKVKRTLAILSKTSNDLEAADLWKRLQSLSEQISK